MDLTEQQISDSSSPSSQTKSCSDCHTTKTPLWRGGPSGPKSLCNACGIKYNKKRRALLGLNSGNKNKKKIGGLKQLKNSSSGSISCGEEGRSLKLRLVTMGGRGDMVLQQRPPSSSSAAAAAAANQQQKEQQMRSKKFGEEEQAAILLMALSCGSFY